MKKLFSILAVMLVAVVLLSACKKVDDRDKFIATYKITEREAGFPDEEYVITITKSTANADEVIISNLFSWLQPNMSFNASVKGKRIVVYTQNYGGFVTCTASGSLDGITLDMDAQLSYSGGSFNPKISGKKL